MANGSFVVTTTNQYVSGGVSWSSAVISGQNASNVTATMYLSRTNQGYGPTYGTGTFHVNINGTDVSNTLSYSIDYNSNTIMVSGTVQVAHNADGTKSITISWSGGGGINDPFTVNSGSGTATLDTISGTSGVVPNCWIWNGTSWVRAKAFKVWNGSAWVDMKSVGVWTGSQWNPTK